ncbi:MAG: ABC transporter permease subunit [Armatimonadetes bacterium]|nr:ABC transporter permease subunit [Armatimonadota bacterium]NIM23004.1 ABC transporter permease subunit [Armatimonadota bacterium]NIM66875.1 ABC transporter permease subunit [Armatimonadota bacterium]NIM75415.1 ABC transporter permease subunit [Armatimonadota bacterium]NIN05062.1 ABC transporter permease subunit [Armatimonadota bacterium]
MGEAKTEKSRGNPRVRQDWSGYLFILPAAAIFSIFVALPVLFTFYISFHDWPLLAAPGQQPPYVGLDNYRRVLTDEEFRRSFINTVYYVVGTVPATLIIALMLALLLNTGLRGITWYRTAFFTPVVTAGVAVGLLWRWVFNTDYGLLNYGLKAIGLPTAAWLDSVHLAMPAIIIASVWKGVGWGMVIFLAGLQGIPEHLYEAARLDGASGWKQFRHITVPLLFPAIFFVLIMSIIGSFQVFDLVYVMTGGGPLHATDVIIFYLYQFAFQRFQLGYAAAVSYVLFAVIFLVTLAQMRVFGRRVQYEM